MNTVAILLGRKGSKGLPGKNTMKLLGRPLLHYPLLAATHSKYVNNIYLTTDDPNIASEAAQYKVELIDRPNHLCTDAALFEDALVHAYKEVKSRSGKTPDYVVVLMCNAPTIDATLIDKAIEALEENPEADSAVTVTCLNMYSPLRARRLNKDGYLDPFVPFETFGDPATLNCDRDSQGDSYFADMSHTVARARSIENINQGLLPQRWMGKKILPVHNTFGCDIDAAWQISVSHEWLKERGFDEDTVPYDD